MNITDGLPSVLILAQTAAAASDHGGVNALWTYGPLGIWVAWMIYRDKRESDKQDKRHEENLAQQRRTEEALRTSTSIFITGMAGLQNLDESFSRLLKRIETENTEKE